MVNNNDQTEQQKEERKNARSAARSKEQSDLSKRQEAEITQLLKARREEDQAQAQAEQDRSNDRQKADAASEQEDQRNEQEAQKQLNELKGKFLQRATERANQVKEPNARARAAAKYNRRALRLAEEANSFHRQIIGWRSGLAKKIYLLALASEEAFDTENYTFLKMMRGFEDEELSNKHTTEKALLIAKYNEEDRLDEKGDTGGDAEDSEDYKKEKEKIQHARDKVQKSIDERRDEVKKEHLLRLVGLKAQLKLNKKAVTEEYRKKLKTIYDARARKPSGKPYRVDRESAQEGVPQQTYLDIVNENETPDKPLSLARRNVEATHAYIKKLIGGTPWLERCGIGEVLSVNKNSHRCTVQLGSSPSYDTIENCTTTTVPVTTTHTVTTTQAVKDANGNVTGFENVEEEVTTTVNLQETICIPDFTLNDQGHVILSNVRYGATHPKKGNSYVVHIPAVYRDAKTHYDAGRPWILVPEEKGRFLYRKAWNSPVMVRYNWPPPIFTGSSDKWEVETVNEHVNLQTQMFGASTPEKVDGIQKTTEIVLQGWDGRIHGVFGEGGGTGNIVYDFYHYEEMGFGKLVNQWTPNPPFVILQSIANDGVTTAGYNVKSKLYTIPGPEYWYAGPTYLASHYECCQVGIDHATYCLTINNYETDVLYGQMPDTHELHNSQAKMWDGKLGSMATKIFIDLIWSLIEVVTKVGGGSPPPITGHPPRGAVCSGSGCHFALFDILFWDFFECHDPAPLAPHDLHAWLLTQTGRGFARADSRTIKHAFGAWEYDDKPATAYSWVDYKVHSWPDISRLFDESDDQHLFVQGEGCEPSVATNITMNADGLLVEVVLGALDPDRNIILWARNQHPPFSTEETSPDRVFKWSMGSGWQDVPKIDKILLLSRDGTDALGSLKGVHYFTIDSGETWNQCPQLPEENMDYVKFVDEIEK